MTEFIQIDGSFLEGGGQILRIALSLSCILRKPVRVRNIRANRGDGGGLKNQHLNVLNMLTKICGAEVKGAALKSTVVEFVPGVIKCGKYRASTGTAASVTLILQAVLPVLLFSDGESELEFIGGTNVPMAPQVEYLTEVLLPNLNKFGATFEFKLIKRGYYPQGGGILNVTVNMVAQLNAANIIEHGKLTKIEGWIYAAGRVDEHVTQVLRSKVVSRLAPLYGAKVLDIMAYKEPPDVARGNALGMVIKAVTDTDCYIGASALHQIGSTPANKAVIAAVNELSANISNQVCVDVYAQDQLIIYMALADGVSSMKTCELSNHTLAAMHVVSAMTDIDFDVQRSDKHVIVSCKGLGHANQLYKH